MSSNVVPNWTQDETFEYINRDTRNPIDVPIAFTDTYIVSLNYFHCPMQHPTVLQVFTLPPDGCTVENGNPVLCLTHEGVVDDFQPVDVEFLKPLVDPVTGATHLRLLDSTYLGRDFRVTRIDLTLPEPRADEVSPMTVDMREYKLLNYQSQPTIRYETSLQYVDVSEEGVVRGFYRGILPVQHKGSSFEVENDDVMKFTIDTRQDKWVVKRGKLSPAEWSHLEDTWLDESIMFDGMRGKICFSDPNEDYENVVVLDIE
jgi:hypothetical protein